MVVEDQILNTHQLGIKQIMIVKKWNTTELLKEWSRLTTPMLKTWNWNSHYWWKCKMTQSLWKLADYLTKLMFVYLPYGLSIPLLEI